jgi:hypothetical protein
MYLFQRYVILRRDNFFKLETYPALNPQKETRPIGIDRHLNTIFRLVKGYCAAAIEIGEYIGVQI